MKKETKANLIATGNLCIKGARASIIVALAFFTVGLVANLTLDLKERKELKQKLNKIYEK